MHPGFGLIKVFIYIDELSNAHITMETELIMLNDNNWEKKHTSLSVLAAIFYIHFSMTGIKPPSA